MVLTLQNQDWSNWQYPEIIYHVNREMLDKLLACGGIDLSVVGWVQNVCEEIIAGCERKGHRWQTVRGKRVAQEIDWLGFYACQKAGLNVVSNRGLGGNGTELLANSLVGSLNDILETEKLNKVSYDKREQVIRWEKAVFSLEN
jgi:hypothetical protein